MNIAPQHLYVSILTYLSWRVRAPLRRSIASGPSMCTFLQFSHGMGIHIFPSRLIPSHLVPPCPANKTADCHKYARRSYLNSPATLIHVDKWLHVRTCLLCTNVAVYRYIRALYSVTCLLYVRVGGREIEDGRKRAAERGRGVRYYVLRAYIIQLGRMCTLSLAATG